MFTGASMRFKLRFLPHRIGGWAARYGEAMDDAVPTTVGAAVKQRGYVEMEEFLAVARWKTPRSQALCASNPPEFVREVTGIALATENERVAIEVLTLLRGVSWPTASVFLHFCSPRPYPILDFRALWSLSCDADASAYDFSLWQAYVECTRTLAKTSGVSMRELDRALWAFSKIHQRAGT
jgi:thermostable 8-oxoguanine DNA glycosylase